MIYIWECKDINSSPNSPLIYSVFIKNGVIQGWFTGVSPRYVTPRAAHSLNSLFPDPYYSKILIGITDD